MDRTYGWHISCALFYIWMTCECDDGKMKRTELEWNMECLDKNWLENIISFLLLLLVFLSENERWWRQRLLMMIFIGEIVNVNIFRLLWKNKHASNKCLHIKTNQKKSTLDKMIRFRYEIYTCIHSYRCKHILIEILNTASRSAMQTHSWWMYDSISKMNCCVLAYNWSTVYSDYYHFFFLLPTSLWLIHTCPIIHLFHRSPHLWSYKILLKMQENGLYAVVFFKFWMDKNPSIRFIL